MGRSLRSTSLVGGSSEYYASSEAYKSRYAFSYRTPTIPHFFRFLLSVADVTTTEKAKKKYRDAEGALCPTIRVRTTSTVLICL